MLRLRPEERANLRRWLDQKRTQIKRQRRSGRVDSDLIGELGHVYQDLENRGEYEEALKVVEVAFWGLVMLVVVTWVVVLPKLMSQRIW